MSAREVIRSVACSSCHILSLTNLGMVYSCGDGSHGQLGHDSLDSSRHLRPITYFIDGSNNEIKRIVQISAGSGRVGSHSAAVDTEGSLYSWGKTIMCGHFAEIRHNSGDKSLTLLPKKVKALEVRCYFYPIFT
jgi:Alpha-tubulin suppressor and related RCC1 domain-containing proteins